MKLSPLQKQLIPLLQYDALQPLTTLAQQLKSRTHTVRYAVRSLLAGGVLRLSPYVNRPLLGYLDYHIFFSLKARDAEKRKEILTQLAAAPGVVFLAALGGDFQYQLIFAGKAPDQLLSLFESLNKRDQQFLLQKNIAMVARYTPYVKKYFSTHRTEKSNKSLSSTELHKRESFAPITLDAVSLKILRYLSKHGFDSIRESARALDLPYATLHARLESLKEQQVLLGFYYDVEPLSYGYQEFILILRTSAVSQAYNESLFAFCREHRAITYATSLIGEWDYELGIDVERSEDIVLVTQELSDQFGAAIVDMRLMLRFKQLVYRAFPG